MVFGESLDFYFTIFFHLFRHERSFHFDFSCMILIISLELEAIQLIIE